MIRFALLLMLPLLAACVAPTPYMPADPATGTGFSEIRIEDNRFEVRFIGNSATPPEVVQRYMLFRAAELTLSTGNDWFRIVRRGGPELSAAPAEGTAVRAGRRGRVGARGGRARHGYRARQGYRGGRGYRGRYRYRHRYRPFGPRFGFGFVVGAPLVYYGPAWAYEPRVFAYDARAEIQLFPGEKPADDANAYDASDVVARLGPTIVRPEPVPPS